MEKRAGERTPRIDAVAESLAGLPDHETHFTSSPDHRTRLRFAMLLHFAMLDVAKLTQLFFGRVECVTHRSANIGARMAFFGVVRLAAYDQMSTGGVHLHMHFVHIAFAVLLAARFDGNTAGNEPAVKFLKLGDTLTNIGGEALRRRHIVEGDFEWDFHDVPR